MTRPVDRAEDDDDDSERQGRQPGHRQARYEQSDGRGDQARQREQPDDGDPEHQLIEHLALDSRDRPDHGERGYQAQHGQRRAEAIALTTQAARGPWRRNQRPYGDDDARGADGSDDEPSECEDQTG